MKISKLPIQSQPVERLIIGTAMTNENGVEASMLPINDFDFLNPKTPCTCNGGGGLPMVWA
jgi:hypothetical protein